MPERLTWGSAEIAAALGISIDTYSRGQAARRAAGFPSPLPGTCRRYSPQAVREWIDRGGKPPPVEYLTAEGPAIDSMDDLLARRAQSIAAGRSRFGWRKP